ncbi:MAG: hypothetical protein MUF21_09395 [Gemmatimonadaceae bacterium]|nr:hypothetical protein [Gemmatimonadaceae bacterium]MCU0626679.1 hypothetical protein [Gemmatimonadaceae bacterium]
MHALPGDADAPPAEVGVGAGNPPDPRGPGDEERSRARLLEALAIELDGIPTTHAALARLLEVGTELLGAVGAWIGLTLEDADALVVVAQQGQVPVESGTRVPRDTAFAARALRAHAAVFADPATGVRWPDALVDARPVRAVAAPIRADDREIGTLAFIGGGGRLFTMADGGLALDLATLAARRLGRSELPADAVAEGPTDIPAALTQLLLGAVAATDADSFARDVVETFNDRSLLGLGVALLDDEGGLRYPAAVGALATLRGTRAILDDGARAPLLRQRRSIAVSDARQLVPAGWRVLLPALPATSIVLSADGVVVGRIDALFDSERPVPQQALERIGQHAALVARSFRALARRSADTGSYLGAAALRAMRANVIARLHDVTSPIAGISALTELLVDEPLPGEARELVALIRQSTQRAIDAAGALRTLTDDPTVHERTATDVGAVIRAVLRERVDAHRALSIDIVATVDPALPPVPFPAGVLRDWLLIALSEAERALFGAARRRVEIRAALEEMGAVVVVADDGTSPTSATTVRDVQGATVTRRRTDDGWTLRRLYIPLRIGVVPPPPLP